MSRRAPNPAADRAAQNTLTIKSLLKLEGNKTCADCKRNKHPRWASWNLGIFICIRCSGIHRGMGTHISRVKSVDLDSWTDEQLASVLMWGNARANKYWEAKLAPGHVPSEAKIENFIRTKYESKRWVMEGPIPDPSTLDAEGDDDVPLSLVKEKHNIERSASQKAPGQPSGPSAVRRVPQQDLFAEDAQEMPRASTTSPPMARPAPKAEAAPPKQTKPADSLLGLDFFDTSPVPQNRPASAAATPGAGGQSRPDLKQSILSLYASAPRTQPQQPPQQPQHASHGSFGGMQSPSSPQSTQTSFGGLNDAFSGLNFSSSSSAPMKSPTTQPQNAKPSAFAGLGALPTQRSNPSQTSSSSNYGGGGFFDAKPAQKPVTQAPPPASRTFSSSSGFGAFDSAPGGSPLPIAQSTSSSGFNDLFDFSTPAAAAPAKQTIASPPLQSTSVFNLSAPQPPPPQAKPAAPAATLTGWDNSDAWGSNAAWSTPEAAPKATSSMRPAPPVQAASNDFGWGGGSSLASQSIMPGGGGGFSPTTAAPQVSADEDFGGWSSAAPVTPGAGAGPSATSAKPPTGFGATDDALFSNVWG